MPPVAEGQVLAGPQFAEPVRVETIKQVSPGAWEIGVSGLNTQKFRKASGADGLDTVVHTKVFAVRTDKDGCSVHEAAILGPRQRQAERSIRNRDPGLSPGVVVDPYQCPGA